MGSDDRRLLKTRTATDGASAEESRREFVSSDTQDQASKEPHPSEDVLIDGDNRKGRTKDMKE